VLRHPESWHRSRSALRLIAAAAAGLAVGIGFAGAQRGYAQPGAGPALAIGVEVPPAPGGRAVVPVDFKANGAAIASLVYSIDYDATRMALDPTDADADGVPDAIRFHVPGGFATSVLLDATDADGEIDVVITDLLPPLGRLPDGSLADMAFDLAGLPAPAVVPVRFSRDPAPSFGSTAGSTVPGTFADGSVRIGAVPAAWIFLPRLLKDAREPSPSDDVGPRSEQLNKR